MMFLVLKPTSQTSIKLSPQSFKSEKMNNKLVFIIYCIVSKKIDSFGFHLNLQN